MKKKPAEGTMVGLTRWMVKTWMPGCSIYKTRDIKKVEKTVKVVKYRRPSKKAADEAYARAQADEFKMRTEGDIQPELDYLDEVGVPEEVVSIGDVKAAEGKFELNPYTTTASASTTVSVPPLSTRDSMGADVKEVI
jgi:hypothetical protein